MKILCLNKLKDFQRSTKNVTNVCTNFEAVIHMYVQVPVKRIICKS